MHEKRTESHILTDQGKDNSHHPAEHNFCRNWLVKRYYRYTCRIRMVICRDMLFSDAFDYFEAHTAI
jgi:hypothetical protein